MNIHEFRKLIDSIDDAEPDYSDKEVTIAISGEHSIGSLPSVKVKAVYSGFDWDEWQIMIYPEERLYRK